MRASDHVLRRESIDRENFRALTRDIEKAGGGNWMRRRRKRKRRNRERQKKRGRQRDRERKSRKWREREGEKGEGRREPKKDKFGRK